MEEITYLNDYPLEEYYILCEQYLKTRINWDAISEEIKQNGVSYFYTVLLLKEKIILSCVQSQTPVKYLLPVRCALSCFQESNC